MFITKLLCNIDDINLDSKKLCIELRDESMKDIYIWKLYHNYLHIISNSPDKFSDIENFSQGNVIMPFDSIDDFNQMENIISEKLLKVSINRLKEISICINSKNINFNLNFITRSTELEKLCLSGYDIQNKLNNLVEHLSNLKDLTLSNNNITIKSLPESFGNLQNLVKLTIINENFDRSIMDQICKLSKLESLTLIGVDMSGEIDPRIYNLINLKTLVMRSCNLSGKISKDIINLSNIKHIDLSDNLLTGTIIKEIGFLPKLKYLDICNNKFTGQIPVDLIHLENLCYLNLANNLNLDEQIMPNIFIYMDRLKGVDLQNTNLIGQIGNTFKYNLKLKELFLTGNKLSHDLPNYINDNDKLNINI